MGQHLLPARTKINNEENDVKKYLPHVVKVTMGQKNIRRRKPAFYQFTFHTRLGRINHDCRFAILR